MNLCRVFWIIALAILGGCQPRAKLSQSPAAAVDVPAAFMHDVFKISSAVVLESHENALLGQIDRIRIDRRNGDILAGDFYTSKMVFRFNAQGQFIHRLGSLGSGPGEHQQLLDFALMDNGQVVLLCPLKLIFFNETGAFEREIDLDFIPHGAEVAGKRLFIRGTSSFLKKLKHAVIALEPGTNRVSSFHPYDPLVDQQFLKPWNAQTLYGDQIVVSEIYDFSLNFYTLNGHQNRQIDFPADNRETENLFKQKHRGSDWDRQLAMAVHRPQFIYGFGGGILIRETHHRQKLDRLALYDPENNFWYRYPSLTEPSPEWGPLLHQIVGSAEKGMIGVCDFVDLKEFGKEFLSGSGFTATPSDNPVVLFFQIDMAANPKPQNPTANQARFH